MIKLKHLLLEDIVYRGQSKKYKKLKNNIWVTDDKEFAEEYGDVKKYKLDFANVNLLDADTEEGEEYEEMFDTSGQDIYYEPSDEFIEFLKSEGYDGYYVNEKNILIFDKNKLKEIK